MDEKLIRITEIQAILENNLYEDKKEEIELVKEREELELQIEARKEKDMNEKLRLSNYPKSLVFPPLYNGYGFTRVMGPKMKKIEDAFSLAVRSRHDYDEIVMVSRDDLLTDLLLVNDSRVVQVIMLTPKEEQRDEAIEKWAKKFRYKTGKDDAEQEKNCINRLMSMLPKEAGGSIWTDGNEILCESRSMANAVADMVEAMYKEAGSYAQATTGFYDPGEDARNGETNDHTGYWNVNII